MNKKIIFRKIEEVLFYEKRVCLKERMNNWVCNLLCYYLNKVRLVLMLTSLVKPSSINKMLTFKSEKHKHVKISVKNID